MLVDNNNFREAAHIGEEIMDGPDAAMDSKCRSVERTIRDGVFTLDKALKLYKVSKETYFAYLTNKDAKNADKKVNQFKEPKIVKSKNGDWYVRYYFRDPNNPIIFKEFKERFGLNYLKDIEQKEREFEILRIDILNWLSAGNSPFDKQVDVDCQVNEAENKIYFYIKNRGA